MNLKTALSLVRSFCTGSIAYTLAISIEALTPLLLLPILTRWLTAEDYGLWVLFIALASFLRPVVGLTLQDAIRMRFFEAPATELRRYFTAAISVSACLTIVLLLAASCTAETVAPILQLPGTWIIVAIVLAFAHGMFYSVLALFQFFGDLKSFVTVQSVNMGLALGLAVPAVMLGGGWQSVAATKIFALIAAILFAQHYLKRLFPSDSVEGIHWPEFRQLLHFGITYLPAGVGSTLIPLSNRFIVARQSGLVDAGLYGVGSQFAAALSLLISGYIYAWQPKLFRAVQSGDAGQLREARVHSMLFLLLLPIAGAVAIVLCFLLLPWLVGQQFLASAPYVGWLVVAMIYQGYFEQNQAQLLSVKSVRAASAAYGLAIGLNVLLNLWLVPRFGGIGSAYATAIAFGVSALINGAIALRQVART